MNKASPSPALINALPPSCFIAGLNDACLDQLAFELMIPVAKLQKYIDLVSTYVFCNGLLNYNLFSPD